MTVMLSSKCLNLFSTYCWHVGQGFYDSLVLEECNNETGLCDIRHGNVYQKFKQSEAHHGDVNISFTLNTDGALLFQSKNCSMWPVLLMINELPFNQRLPKFVLVCFLNFSLTDGAQITSFLLDCGSLMKNHP